MVCIKATYFRSFPENDVKNRRPNIPAETKNGSAVPGFI